MRVTVKYDDREVRRQLHRLGADADLAMARAINKTIASVQTSATRAIAQDVGLKQSDVRRALELVRATRKRLVATLSASSRRLTLLAFGARETRRGVTYRLRRGRGLVPDGFIAEMRSGHVGVFRRVLPTRSRKGKPRGSPALPIEEAHGPSVGRVFKQLLEIRLVQEARALMPKHLAHEVRFLLRKRGAA